MPEYLAGLLPAPFDWMATGIVSAAVSMVVTTALVSMSVLLYLDLRIRTEGLDIELQAAECVRPGVEPTLTGGRIAAALAALIVGAVLLLPSDASAAGAAHGSTSSVAATTAAANVPVPTQDPSTSNQKADQILDRSEFRRASPGSSTGPCAGSASGWPT